MKIHIITHLLPHELDEFERQLTVLSQNVIVDDDITLDVTLNLNTIESSSIPVQFFIDKFNQLKDYATKTKWCKNPIFEINDDKTCGGVGDKRRTSIRKYADEVDAFLYLDSDLIFPAHILPYIIHCAKYVKNKYYIISPQISKIWDHTWDHLVNERYSNSPYGSEKTINPYFIANQNYGDVSLEKSQSIKIGGGWFNLISSNLLKHTDLPDELGPYGPDDTYVMYCSQIMKLSKEDVDQYIMNNVVVAENYLLRNNPYKSYLRYTSSKENLRTKSEQNLPKSIQNFQIKYKYVLK